MFDRTSQSLSSSAPVQPADAKTRIGERVVSEAAERFPEQFQEQAAADRRAASAKAAAIGFVGGAVVTTVLRR